MRWYPMLAKPGVPEVIDNPSYLLEEKLDGIRCLVYVQDRVISLYSRTGKPLDNAFPDVVQSLQGLKDLEGSVFDGEIVPRNDDYTFQNLQTRLQRISNVANAINMCPVKFVMFDVLFFNNNSLLNSPLCERRICMNTVCDMCGVNISKLITKDEAKAILDDPSKEGVMAKHKLHEYYPGTRSSSWWKVKSVRTIEAVIGGCTFGAGRRKQEAASFLLGEVTVEGLKYIGNVGTGFTNEMLADICKLIDVFATLESPFLGWPSSELESALVKSYCQPGKLVAVVNYQERTREGMLRFPSLKSYKVDSEA